MESENDSDSDEDEDAENEDSEDTNSISSGIQQENNQEDGTANETLVKCQLRLHKCLQN